MKSQILFVSALALFAGCSSSGLTPPDPTSLSSDDSELADGKADRQCIHRHQSCTAGGERCCTGFCASTGYYGYGYGQGTCSAFLVDGSYCESGSECKSKVCSDYVCGAPAPACAATKAPCTASADCCAGSCNRQVYSLDYHTCADPQADGTYCTEDRACQSNTCQSYKCVSACATDGVKCAASSSCCSGFCRLGYVTGYCDAPQPNGSYCGADAECLSKHCGTDYLCAS